ncbi:MotA/TolQ/ExbB proton channel family protein [Halorhodospira sp. 9622]|uniref:MotA/TolQ/ExbB proton channel family protein n=1 Tax=Halorhodospira sp. 9622 TaxID=2899136 RepID=UPI001EE7FC03|nr:MotA/TolQ/ExbB proton channel family protein [Halorhodospira sp. 9622]MCG5539350.1 MotA/TolQ/ExbB proton channel family protein [Halorhodospira sp. 9622]
MVAIISAGAGLVWVVLLHFLLPADGYWAEFLLDRQGSFYPLSIQNLMWLIFFVGLGELAFALWRMWESRAELDQHYLPEDEETVLVVDDLGGLYKNLRKHKGLERGYFLPRLIQRVVLQFQSSRSVDQASVLLNSSLELFMHELELRYQMLRYISWLLPTLGFIGTIIGISRALAFAADYGEDHGDLLPDLSSQLAVAFHTTLLGLLMSGVIVFVLYLVQGKEENVLNQVGGYCLDNLINRLYER